MIQLSTNPEKLFRAALDHLLIIKGALITCMELNYRAMDEIAHVILTNRVLGVHNLGEDVIVQDTYNHTPTNFCGQVK